MCVLVNTREVINARALFYSILRYTVVAQKEKGVSLENRHLIIQPIIVPLLDMGHFSE